MSPSHFCPCTVRPRAPKGPPDPAVTSRAPRPPGQCPAGKPSHPGPRGSSTGDEGPTWPSRWRGHKPHL